MPDRSEDIRRYNAHLMDEAERERFEVQMIGDPRLAQDVELDAVLQESLARPLPVPATIGHRRPRARWLPLAAAALLLAGLGLGRLLAPPPSSYSQVVLVALDEMRGPGPGEPRTHEATLDGRSLLVLDIPAPVEPAKPVEVVLVELATQRPAVRMQAISTADGVVSVALPRRSVADGDYEVRVTPEAGTARSYRLRVRSRTAAAAE